MPKSYVRLTQPLVRDSKGAPLRPASWDEALDRAAAAFQAARAAHGPTTFGTFSAARRRPTRSTSRPRSSAGRRWAATTSTAATAPDTPPSVAGLATVFGAGGGTSSYREIEETDLIVLWGSNARETHPIFFHHLLRGVHNGARLYAVDPRRTTLGRVGGRLARPRRWLGHRARQRDRARDHRRRPPQPRIHRARDRPTSRTTGPRSSRTRSSTRSARPASRRRRSASSPTPSRRRRPGDDLLDARHHRAPQRGRQRPRTDQPRAADRPCRPLRQRPEPAPRPEQRPGRRRHGRAARPPDGLPARRERRAAREVRRGLGRDDPAEARLAPVGHVRRDGARRADASLYCIGENPLQSEADQTAGDAPPRRPRLPRRPGHVPDRDGRDRRRRAARRPPRGPSPTARSRTRERRVQRVRKALEPPGEARDDLAIIFDLARRLGRDWGAPTAEEVWNEVRSLSPVHAGMRTRGSRS